MYYVYTLLSLKDQKTYTGSTPIIQKRFLEHQNGEVKSTRYRRPLKLIHLEKFQSEKEARQRERFLKSTRGRKELKRILKNKL